MRLILILILVILIYRGKFFGQNRNVVTRNCSELFVDNFNSFGGGKIEWFWKKFMNFNIIILQTLFFKYIYSKIFYDL